MATNTLSSKSPKQLNKLIEVIKVVDLNESRFVERELMLVKVRAVGKDRDEFLRLTEIYRGSVIDVTDRSYTIEITGSTENSTLSSKQSDAPKFWKPYAQAQPVSAVASVF